MNTNYTLEITPCQAGNHVVVSGSPDLVSACRPGLRSPFRRLRYSEECGKEYLKISCMQGESSDDLCKNIVRALSMVLELRGKDFCNGGNL